MAPEPDVHYQINHRDEIIFVDDAWDRFAATNEGTKLGSKDILGRPLWDFITDATTRQLYKQILARVRQGSVAGFTLRCDGPSRKRLLEMTIRAQGPGSVEFATHTLQVEDRPPVLLLVGGRKRSDDMVKVCSWCNRVKVARGEWAEIEVALETLKTFESSAMPQVTHGMCDTCLAAMTKTVGGMTAGA